MLSLCTSATPLHLYGLDRFVFFIITKIVSYPDSCCIYIYIYIYIYI